MPMNSELLGWLLVALGVLFSGFCAVKAKAKESEHILMSQEIDEDYTRNDLRKDIGKLWIDNTSFRAYRKRVEEEIGQDRELELYRGLRHVEVLLDFNVDGPIRI